MKRLWLLLGLFLTGFVCMAQDQSSSQPLSVAKVASLVLSNSASVLTSGELLRSSGAKYDLLLANSKPQLAFSAGYSYSYSNYMVNDSGYELSGFSVDTASAGFSMEQLLGTYGRLSLKVADQLNSYSGNVAYYDPSFTPFTYGPLFGQSPLVTVSLDQPLFLNDKLLDTDLYGSVFHQGEIGFLEAKEQNRIARNKAIYEAIQLLFDVAKLRNSLDTLTKAVALKHRGVENLEQKLRSGLVAELDVWEMRGEESKERGNLLNCEYSLKQKEEDLKAVLGIDYGQTLTIGPLDLDSPLQTPAQPLPVETAIQQNPTVKICEMELENARLKRIIDGASYASSLNVTLDFSPHYSALRPYQESQADVWESFTDFWKADSGWTASVSVSLNVPLYNGHKGTHQAEADTASQAALREQLMQQKQDLAFKIRMMQQMVSNLRQRIAWMADNAMFKKKQAEVARGLVEIGQKSELDAVNVEIESMQMEKDLAAANMDLFLARLCLRALMGEDLERVIR